MFDGHEGPVGNAGPGVVEPARPGEDTLHPSRAIKLDFDVPSPLVIDMHVDCDVLEELEVGVLEVGLRDLDRRDDAVGRERLARPNDRRGPPGLGLDKLPGLGSVDDGPGVELAEAVLVVEVAARGRHLPVGVVWVDLDGGKDAEVLHVTPSEVGSGRQAAKNEEDSSF